MTSVKECEYCFTQPVALRSIDGEDTYLCQTCYEDYLYAARKGKEALEG